MYQCNICGEMIYHFKNINIFPNGVRHTKIACNEIGFNKFLDDVVEFHDLQWNTNYPVTGERVW